MALHKQLRDDNGAARGHSIRLLGGEWAQAYTVLLDDGYIGTVRNMAPIRPQPELGGWLALGAFVIEHSPGLEPGHFRTSDEAALHLCRKWLEWLMRREGEGISVCKESPRHVYNWGRRGC